MRCSREPLNQAQAIPCGVRTAVCSHSLPKLSVLLTHLQIDSFHIVCQSLLSPSHAALLLPCPTHARVPSLASSRPSALPQEHLSLVKRGMLVMRTEAWMTEVHLMCRVGDGRVEEGRERASTPASTWLDAKRRIASRSPSSETHTHNNTDARTAEHHTCAISLRTESGRTPLSARAGRRHPARQQR